MSHSPPASTRLRWPLHDTIAVHVLRTKTRPAGQSHNYNVGDLVDFFRPPSNKDWSGWKGPAKLIHLTNISRGAVTVRFQPPPAELMQEAWGILSCVCAGKERCPQHVANYKEKGLRRLCLGMATEKNDVLRGSSMGSCAYK